jgi:glycosyltransferase involved in cell wall biosynthesis
LLVSQFDSVRTLTDSMRSYIEQRYNPADLETLPRFQNYIGILEQPKQFELTEKYPPFQFFILYVGLLGHDSTCYRALDAARFVLQNPRVGMIVLGNGSAKKEFEKRAEILGIADKVIFNDRDKDSVPFLKAADMLLVTDTDSWSEELVMRAAAAGTPMVMVATEKREDIFVDGLSAYLCDREDTAGFSDRINDLLMQPRTREQFTEQTHEYIRKTFHDDEAAYRLAYRASIESALFLDSEG